MVAGIGPGDEVLVSTLTFIAPANAIRYVGATPVFIDAEPDYWQMDPLRAAEFLEHECTWNGNTLRNRRTGGRVRAIMPVHILGHPVDMDPIIELAARYCLVIIEDASESLGAKYKGRMTGSLGDIACFSFNGNKILTTGGGGMLVTNNAVWASRARYLTTQAKDNPREYVHSSIGYNYRLTNIQAAVGCAQIELLPQFIQSKRATAARYSGHLAYLKGIRCPKEAPWAFSTFWLYTVLVDQSSCGRDCRSLVGTLEENGIESRRFWQPLHLSPAHTGSPRSGGEIAERIADEGLSLPCSTGIDESSIARVVECLRSACTP
jgi:perosamine synthetase